MSRLWLVGAIAQLWLGCGNDLGYPRDPDHGVDAGSLSPSPSANGTLPCDVQAFLAERCQGCHGAQLANGAPMHLMTYADLVARNEDGILIAERALARIQNPGAQMPPLPQPSATSAQIAMFGAWITANLPSGECAPVKGPFDGPTVCTSGTMWDRGDHESPLMHPGGACLTCHATHSDAPRLQIGGTVYPTGHEPNDCNGVNGASSTTGAVVEVTDAGGQVIMLPVNAAGNFLTTQTIAFPIHVAVVANGKRRSMGASPPNGNCNNCHTQDGANGAPGRIALP